MRGFQCIGRENHCSWDCCSKPYIGLTLNDVLSLTPKRIDDLSIGVELTEKKDYHRAGFYLNKHKGDCNFLKRVDETEFFECVLEHEGFGLDVCKVWPAKITKNNSEGNFLLLSNYYVIESAGGCEALNQLDFKEQLEALTSLLERNREILERKLNHDEWFTNHLNERELNSVQLVPETLAWEGKKVEGGNTYFSLHHDGRFYEKVSFV